MISGCTAWRPIRGFEPELYLLRAAQKRKGIVQKAQNGKGNETPKAYMESDQVVGNRLLFSFLGSISRAMGRTYNLIHQAHILNGKINITSSTHTRLEKIIDACMQVEIN